MLFLVLIVSLSELVDLNKASKECLLATVFPVPTPHFSSLTVFSQMGSRI